MPPQTVNSALLGERQPQLPVIRAVIEVLAAMEYQLESTAGIGAIALCAIKEDHCAMTSRATFCQPRSNRLTADTKGDTFMQQVVAPATSAAFSSASHGVYTDIKSCDQSVSIMVTIIVKIAALLPRRSPSH